MSGLFCTGRTRASLMRNMEGSLDNSPQIFDVLLGVFNAYIYLSPEKVLMFRRNHSLRGPVICGFAIIIYVTKHACEKCVLNGLPSTRKIESIYLRFIFTCHCVRCFHKIFLLNC